MSCDILFCRNDLKESFGDKFELFNFEVESFFGLNCDTEIDATFFVAFAGVDIIFPIEELFYFSTDKGAPAFDDVYDFFNVCE